MAKIRYGLVYLAVPLRMSDQVVVEIHIFVNGPSNDYCHVSPGFVLNERWNSTGNIAHETEKNIFVNKCSLTELRHSIGLQHMPQCYSVP